MSMSCIYKATLLQMLMRAAAGGGESELLRTCDGLSPLLGDFTFPCQASLQNYFFQLAVEEIEDQEVVMKLVFNFVA